MLTLSQSTLDGLSINDRGVLSKPIQFFDKLQELFSGSSAGTFMEDPSSAADFDDDDDDTDKFDIFNDMSTYADTKDPQGEDLDKLSSNGEDCKEVVALSADAGASQVSSSNTSGLKPNDKSFKRFRKPETLPPPHNDKGKKLKAKQATTLHDDDDVDVLITSTGIKDNLQKSI